MPRRSPGRPARIDDAVRDACFSDQAHEMFRRVRRQLGRLHDDCVSRRQSRNQLHADGDERAVPGDDDADDAVRLRHRVGELTLVGREGRDPPFDLVGPARVVRTSSRHDADERLADAVAVIPLSSTDSRASSSASRSSSSPSRRRTRARCHGVQVRQAWYAAWAARTAASTSSGPASGTGPWTSPVAGYTWWCTPPEPLVRASPPMCRCTSGTVRSTVIGSSLASATTVKLYGLLVRHLTSRSSVVPNARVDCRTVRSHRQGRRDHGRRRRHRRGLRRGAAERGASVVIADVDIDAAQHTADALDAQGIRAIAVQLDVTSADSAARWPRRRSTRSAASTS